MKQNNHVRVVRVRGVSTNDVVALLARFVLALSWERRQPCKEGARRMTYTGWRGRENMGCLVMWGVYTNDEECSGIAIVYSSCSAMSVSMSTLSVHVFNLPDCLMIPKQKSCSCTERYLRERVYRAGDCLRYPL